MYNGQVGYIYVTSVLPHYDIFNHVTFKTFAHSQIHIIGLTF